MVVVGSADAALDAGATVTTCVDWRVVKRVCVSVTWTELTGAGEDAGGAGTDAGTDGAGGGELAGAEGVEAGEVAGGTSIAVLEVAGKAAALDVDGIGAGTGTTVTETGMTVVDIVAGQLVTVAGHSVMVISCVLNTVDVT